MAVLKCQLSNKEAAFALNILNSHKTLYRFFIKIYNYCIINVDF